MVLEKLRDGAARRLLFPDEDARRLIFILCLPLIDGVFATLLVTGAIQTFSDIIAISLTVFTGAGALAVLYSCSENRGDALEMVLQAAPYLLFGAMALSIIAPVYEQLFYIERLRIAAILALLSISLQLFGLDIADKLSVPAILVTGMALSLKNVNEIVLSTEYILPAIITAMVSIGALIAATRIKVSTLNLNYIRKGASIVLLIIAISLYGFSIPSEIGLAIFAFSFLASYKY